MLQQFFYKCENCENLLNNMKQRYIIMTRKTAKINVC